MNIVKVLSSTVLFLLTLSWISNDFKLDLVLFLKLVLTSLICLYSFSQPKSSQDVRTANSSLSQVPRISADESTKNSDPLKERLVKTSVGLSEKYQTNDLPIKKLIFDNLENSPTESLNNSGDYSIEPKIHIILSPRRKPAEMKKPDKNKDLRIESKKILDQMKQKREKNSKVHQKRLEDMRKNYEEMIENSKIEYNIESFKIVSNQTLEIPVKPHLPVIHESKEHEVNEVSSDFTPMLNQPDPDFKVPLEAGPDQDFNPVPLGSKPLEKSVFELQMKNISESCSEVPPHMVLPVHKVKSFTPRDPILKTYPHIDHTQYESNGLDRIKTSAFMAHSENSGQVFPNPGFSENIGSQSFFITPSQYSGPYSNPQFEPRSLATGGNSFPDVNTATKSYNFNAFGERPTITQSSQNDPPKSLATNPVNPFVSEPKPGTVFSSNSFNAGNSSNIRVERVNPFTSQATTVERANPFAGQSSSSSMKIDSFSNQDRVSTGLNLGPVAESGYTTPVNPVFKLNHSSLGGETRLSQLDSSSHLPGAFSKSGPTSTIPAGRSSTRTSLTTGDVFTAGRPANTTDFYSLEIQNLSIETYSQIKNLIPMQERSIKSSTEDLLRAINEFYSVMSETEQVKRIEKIFQIFSAADFNKLSILAVNFSFYCVDNLIDNYDNSEVLLKFCEYFVKVFILLEKEFKGICRCLLFELQTRNSVFTGKSFTVAEVQQSWRLEDLKRLSQGGELQKKNLEEMKQLETLAVLQTVFFIESAQVNEIQGFLTKIQSTPRQVLPVLVGTLTCLQGNPRLQVVNFMKSVVFEHGRRIEESKQFCNQLFFTYEILKFKELYNRIYG